MWLAPSVLQGSFIQLSSLRATRGEPAGRPNVETRSLAHHVGAALSRTGFMRQQDSAPSPALPRGSLLQAPNAYLLPGGLDLPRHPGASLSQPLQARLQDFFRTDFSSVRCHSSLQAKTLGARAFTAGDTIVFAPGFFDAATSHGRRLIAHELSHVVQQRSGPVDGADAPGGIKVSDPGDRFERAADATADRVMGGDRAPAGPGGAAPSLQLEPEDDEGAMPVQRQENVEEDDEEGAPE